MSGDRTLDLVSGSVAETQALGVRLGELARAGDLYCLEGELGSGKTCFVQGLGRGLGITEDIHSPSFILANEHRGGRLTLFHLDVYRVRGPDEAIGFGLDDYLGGEGVCVVEWADKIAAALPSERLWIVFRHVDEFRRGVAIRARGARYEDLMGQLRSSLAG